MKQIFIWLIFLFFAGFSVVRPGAILVKRECKPVIQSSTLNVIGVIQKVHVYVRIVIRTEQLHLRVIGCITYKALGLTSSQLATLAKDVWLGLIRESAGCPKADSVKWAGLRWKIFFFFAVLKWQLRERRAASERERSFKVWRLETRVAGWKWMKGKNVETTEAVSDLRPQSGDTGGTKQEAGNNVFAELRLQLAPRHTLIVAVRVLNDHFRVIKYKQITPCNPPLAMLISD